MVDVMVTGGRMPPDIQYFLDGSAECFDIPVDVYFWGRYFCPNLTELIDNMDKDASLVVPGHHGSTLTNYGMQLERMYLEWQNQADPHAVALCLAYGMHFMPSPEKIIGDLCNTLVDDELGTIAKISFYSSNTRHQKDGLVYFDGMKMFERKRHFMESRARIIRQWDEVKELDLREIKLVWPEPIRYVDFIDEYRSSKPAPEKSTRKALKRSAKLLDAVAGENTVKLFLSGSEVSVTGNKYRFSLTKDKYGSITGSHGAAVTRVYDVASNEFICGLCVYTKNVTVFDHLASIVLHCKSGLEEVIIDEANVTERGRIDLLPKTKYDKLMGLNKPEPFLDADDFEHVGLREIEDRFDIVERKENSIAAAIYGPGYRLVAQRKRKVDQANEKAKSKLVHRIRRKHPELFVKPSTPVAHLAQLFNGPQRLL